MSVTDEKNTTGTLSAETVDLDSVELAGSVEETTPAEAVTAEAEAVVSNAALLAAAKPKGPRQGGDGDEVEDGPYKPHSPEPATPLN
ncbi:hypothetical protein GCM10022243_49460 [Saccharothrix violaceirubra]|uniref:Uncharacterized protein n=1 Tax=Saccharothrix violaceirubra TaxID=413306 RepID=A0A7W7WTZ3_9PSEU|nr:hypothetical protein [Saccharothrix violaceirubra]MBB4963710.1 hypothetical protein [Saccharothrix violaceirubra]